MPILATTVASLFFVGLFLAACSVRKCPPEERLAISRLGRPRGLRGPGMVFLFPFLDRAVRIRLDTRGKLLAKDRADMSGVPIPIRPANAASVGALVKIVGFEELEEAQPSEGSGSLHSVRAIVSVESDPKRLAVAPNN